jgi:hypothetical protein
VSRKVDGTQRSGRGTAPSAAGGFGGADTALTRLARPFVPKPFRSTGGMSTSADTMASIGMGRHNVEDEIPEDQINISSIVSRKTSDRRYLPRKLGNMKRYLHTTPLNEVLNLPADDIQQRFELYEISLSDFTDFGKSLVSGAKTKLQSMFGKENPEIPNVVKSAVGLASSFVPFVGDAYKGYLAYQNFSDIQDEVSDLQQMLGGDTGDMDFFAPPAENRRRIETGDIDLDIRRATDLISISEKLKMVADLCINFLSNAFSAIPLEVVPGLAMVDAVIDSLVSTALGANVALDPEGDITAQKFYDLSIQLGDALRTVEGAIGSIIPGKDFAESNKISNLVGNLALVYGEVNKYLKQLESPEEVHQTIFERKSKKKKRANEMSTVANISGYTGPMASPKNPKQFYSTMAKAAGSEYLVDPVKTSRPKP